VEAYYVTLISQRTSEGHAYWMFTARALDDVFLDACVRAVNSDASACAATSA